MLVGNGYRMHDNFQRNNISPGGNNTNFNRQNSNDGGNTQAGQDISSAENNRSAFNDRQPSAMKSRWQSFMLMSPSMPLLVLWVTQQSFSGALSHVTRTWLQLFKGVVQVSLLPITITIRSQLNQAGYQRGIFFIFFC